MSGVDRGAILVTRPQPDGDAFAAALGRAGAGPVIIHPMMTIRHFPDIALPDDAGAIAFTSANGVRALAAASGRSTGQHIPAYAVGPVTAEAAREAGFRVAGVAESGVESLAAMIAAAAPSGRIVHVSGTARAGNLAATLAKAGLNAVTLHGYEAQALARLPGDLRRALRDGGIEAATFFSPRTARIFRQLIDADGLAGTLCALRCLCLSEAVAREFDGMAFARVETASQPHTAALIDIVLPGRK